MNDRWNSHKNLVQVLLRDSGRIPYRQRIREDDLPGHSAGAQLRR